MHKVLLGEDWGLHIWTGAGGIVHQAHKNIVILSKRCLPSHQKPADANPGPVQDLGRRKAKQHKQQTYISTSSTLVCRHAAAGSESAQFVLCKQRPSGRSPTCCKAVTSYVSCFCAAMLCCSHLYLTQQLVGAETLARRHTVVTTGRRSVAARCLREGAKGLSSLQPESTILTACGYITHRTFIVYEGSRQPAAGYAAANVRFSCIQRRSKQRYLT